jgi:hypothetical protein
MPVIKNSMLNLVVLQMFGAGALKDGKAQWY